jgi:hypothetical protein
MTGDVVHPNERSMAAGASEVEAAMRAKAFPRRTSDVPGGACAIGAAAHVRLRGLAACGETREHTLADDLASGG